MPEGKWTAHGVQCIQHGGEGDADADSNDCGDAVGGDEVGGDDAGGDNAGGDDFGGEGDYGDNDGGDGDVFGADHSW